MPGVADRAQSETQDDRMADSGGQDDFRAQTGQPGPEADGIAAGLPLMLQLDWFAWHETP